MNPHESNPPETTQPFKQRRALTAPGLVINKEDAPPARDSAVEYRITGPEVPMRPAARSLGDRPQWPDQGIPIIPGVTPYADRLFTPTGAKATPEAVLAAEKHLHAFVPTVKLPAGVTLYPCPSQFSSWSKEHFKDWFQVVQPTGSETTLTRDELYEKFGKVV